MKLKDYIAKLNKLAEKHPDVEVIYSCDDEGNEFQKVHFPPSIGSIANPEDDRNLEWSHHSDDYDVNAVCIN